MTRYDHSGSDVALVDWDAVARGRDGRRASSAEHEAIEREARGDAPTLPTLALRAAIVGGVAGSLGGPVWTLVGAAAGLGLALAFAERDSG